MSYCRFSSDNFCSDLYCYEDCMGGFTTHVASNRAVGEIPSVPHILKCTPEEYVAASVLRNEFLETCERVDIGLPHDGASFNDPDLQSFLARVEQLKAAGYHVPEWVIPEIEREIKEASEKP